MKLALRPYMKQIMYINQALSLERDRLNETQKQAAEHRNFIKMQLACGVTIDIFLTLALLIFFLKNITDRLSLLVNNARLLPTGQPLPSSVPGSDELAYLDQVLHQASTELERAAEYRQSMMETMSHDLRSPIQSALIIAEVFDALPVVQQSEKLSRQLDSLKRNLTRVVRLVEDHLTMDKLESGTVELAVSSFDLRDLVAETIDCVAAQAMLKSIELSNKVEAIEVEADKERILQVLTNFLTNAIKYSPRSAPVLISSQHLGHSVKIMVLDDGPGLEGDELARIFERFQQTSTGAKSREGFGLGLAICKLLVNQHGGTVGVTSTPGKGSTFWFTLPIRYTPQK
jgi:signal transduction histidine kinase